MSFLKSSPRTACWTDGRGGFLSRGQSGDLDGRERGGMKRHSTFFVPFTPNDAKDEGPECWRPEEVSRTLRYTGTRPLSSPRERRGVHLLVLLPASTWDLGDLKERGSLKTPVCSCRLGFSLAQIPELRFSYTHGIEFSSPNRAHGLLRLSRVCASFIRSAPYRRRESCRRRHATG